MKISTAVKKISLRSKDYTCYTDIKNYKVPDIGHTEIMVSIALAGNDEFAKNMFLMYYRIIEYTNELDDLFAINLMACWRYNHKDLKMSAKTINQISSGLSQYYVRDKWRSKNIHGWCQIPPSTYYAKYSKLCDDALHVADIRLCNFLSKLDEILKN